MFSCEFCEISKNTFIAGKYIRFDWFWLILIDFTEYVWATAFKAGNLKLSEAATGDFQLNKMFLKISQVSQESLSEKVAVLRASNFIKKDSNAGGFLWILCIQEHLF